MLTIFFQGKRKQSIIADKESLFVVDEFHTSSPLIIGECK